MPAQNECAPRVHQPLQNSSPGGGYGGAASPRLDFGIHLPSEVRAKPSTTTETAQQIVFLRTPKVALRPSGVLLVMGSWYERYFVQTVATC